MSYFLLHRYDSKEPQKVRKQPFSTEPEAVIHACSLLAGGAQGDFEIRDDKDDIVTNDQEIRDRCKAMRMP
jgi:hypothetical protein